MHVGLVKDEITAYSKRLKHGDTPDCIEITYEVNTAPQPDSVWLSFFHSALEKAEPFALRNLSTKGDRIRFPCRGDEVEYALEALKRLVTETNAVYYSREPAQSSEDLALAGEEKKALDRELVERAKRFLPMIC